MMLVTSSSLQRRYVLHDGDLTCTGCGHITGRDILKGPQQVRKSCARKKECTGRVKMLSQVSSHQGPIQECHKIGSTKVEVKG